MTDSYVGAIEPEPRAWCPLCEPRVDQMREYVVEHRCHRHTERFEGEHVENAPVVGQAGGEYNRRMCDLLHRGIV